MDKNFITAGLFLVLIGILIGAFAAHGLEQAGIDDEKQKSFQVAIRYLFYNGLGMLAIAALREKFDFTLKFNYRTIFFGTLFFSGSIFALVLLPLMRVHLTAILAPITPVGGILMAVGWGTLLIKYVRAIEKV